MKINIKATNIELTQAISDYVEKKVQMLEKYLDQGVDEEPLVYVEVGKSTRHHKSGDVYKAEVHLTSSGKEYYATVEKDDLYAAIDEVKDEVARSINSSRKKAIALIRRGGTRVKEILKNMNLRSWRSWKWRR